MDTPTSSTSDDLRDFASGAVVVGIDGSTYADDCVAWAAERARLEERPLGILHAADSAQAYRDVWRDGAAIDHVTMMRDVEANARRLVEAAAERARALQPGLAVRGHYSLDDARHTLLEAGEHAALLVVGSRGRGPIGSLLLGSVSTAVSRHADCPVVVLRPGAATHHGGVVVGVDGRPESEAVLDFAFREASLRRCALTAVHTHLDQIAMAYGVHVTADASEVDELVRTLAETVAGYAEKFPDVEVTRQVRRGAEVGDVLLGADANASMIVVGRRHTGGPLASLHRGVASTIIEHADTSVAVVPTG